MPVVTSIEDLKRMHRARTPRMFYDYAESGSYTEQTFRENTTDFARLKLRQKVAVDMSNRSTASDIVGLPATMPVALAPVGLTGMQHADGEIHAARAAVRLRAVRWSWQKHCLRLLPLMLAVWLWLRHVPCFQGCL